MFWIPAPISPDPEFRQIEELTFVGITDMSVEIHTGSTCWRITAKDFLSGLEISVTDIAREVTQDD